MEMFDEFKQIINEGNDRNKYEQYPNHKRFSLFIDRRNKGTNDELTFFEPPSVCSRMPKDHVSEWYFESVRKCIIPRKGFGDGLHERDHNIKAKPDTTTINSQSTVCGKLM